MSIPEHKREEPIRRAAFEAKRAEIEKRGAFYVSIADGESECQPKPIPPDHRGRAAFLFQLLDDIDTLGDIAKSDDAGYRAAVERIQKRRWESGIRTDGYELYFPGEPMPPDISEPCEAVAPAQRAGKAS